MLKQFLNVIVLVPLLIFCVNPTVARKCLQRDYGNGRTVCVCNSTYCDTIPRPQQVPSHLFLTYTSTQTGLRFKRSNGTFKLLKNKWKYPTNKIFIDSSTKYQTILGWGGAFTDSTGINIEALSKELQEVLLKSLFSDEGIEYNLCRVPMGGSDFSTRAYTYDDGEEDPELKNFQLAPEDFKYKIPYILRAENLTKGNLRLFCSPWMAPKWMKTNNEYTGFGFIRRSLYEAWTNYYVKFLDAYQHENISFWGLTTGNEPFLILNPITQIGTVGWPSWSLVTWISKYLGPIIRNSRYSNISIIILDDQRMLLPWYPQKVFRSNLARKYVDGIGVHWYFDKVSSPELLTRTRNLFPEKFILETEASIIHQPGEPAVSLGSWQRGELYSKDIIENIQNWVTGWVDWNMVLNLEGGPSYINNSVDACIIVNVTGGEFFKQPMYYHLGHFSKFVPRGSVRVRSTCEKVEEVDVVAFQRPDNGTAVVLLNRKEDVIRVNLIDVIKGVAQLKLPKKSITTMLYW